MRDLKIFSLSLFLLTACKTHRPVVDIETRSRPESGVLMTMDEEDSKAEAYLKISALSFPVDAIPFTRIALLLQAPGKEDRPINNYTLKDKIPVQPGIKYALTVTVYKNGEPIYSNQYCKNSNKFTAKVGSNNYTVPMCLLPELPLPPKE